MSTSTSMIHRPLSVISNLSNAVAIDIHIKQRFIFWSDVAERSIKRALLDGTNVKTIVNDVIGVCDGIAVEWTSGLLYWTDTSYQKIEVSRLDGTNRNVLIADNLQRPRGIALDPHNG